MMEDLFDLISTIIQKIMPKKKKKIEKKTEKKKVEEDFEIIEEMAEGGDFEEVEKKVAIGGKDLSLKLLIEKNIKWSQIIYKQNQKIKRRLTMVVIGNYIRLLLIFIPIILGAVYLFPFVNKQMEKIQPIFEILGSSPNTGSAFGNIFDQLSPQDMDQAIKSLDETNK